VSDRERLTQAAFLIVDGFAFENIIDKGSVKIRVTSLDQPELRSVFVLHNNTFSERFSSIPETSPVYTELQDIIERNRERLGESIHA